MKVIPLHDRVLLKRLEEKETVKGGIIIPDTAKEKPQEAEVIAVGKGRVAEDGKVIPLEDCRELLRRADPRRRVDRRLRSNRFDRRYCRHPSAPSGQAGRCHPRGGRRLGPGS